MFAREKEDMFDSEQNGTSDEEEARGCRKEEAMFEVSRGVTTLMSAC